MTKRLLIANIGQRDLALDYDGLSQCEAALSEKLQDAAQRPKPNLRKWGALLLDHMNTVLPFLRAPILDVALCSLGVRGELPEHLVLAGTKQEDKEFQRGDTFRCAEALIPVLLRDYPDISRVQTAIINGAPNDLNLMLPQYANLCRSLSAERVYALCTGGTPACNMALSLRAVEFFGEGCAVMHVAEDTTEPTNLNVGRYIFDQHRRAALKRLAGCGDFDAIAEDAGYPPPVRRLAQAAAARMNFNFTESLNLVQGVKHLAVDERLDELLEEARLLARGDDRKAALAEIYWNAVLKWQRGEYADFLGRVCRLLEGSLQDILSAVLHFKGGPDAFRTEFEGWTQGTVRESYRTYVFQQITHKKNKTAPETISASIPALIMTVKYLVNYDAGALKRVGLDASKAGELAEAAGKLRPLVELRNKSIMAHGFGGVWKDNILTQKGGPAAEEELLACLHALLNAQDIVPGANPYHAFADTVVALNREMNYDDN